MSTTDDFTPIAERGEFDAPTGLLGRFRRRPDPPSISPGFTRVVVDQAGQVLDLKRPPTPGQKQHQPAHAWLLVDVRDHTLKCTVHLSDPHSTAGFVATVNVNSAIADPEMVAVRGIDSVRDHLEPAIVEAAADAASTDDAAAIAEDSDPITNLNKARGRFQAALREHLESTLARHAPPWLTVSVVSVSVTLDEVTQRHYDDLTARLHRGDLIDADADNKNKTDTADIAGRQRWRAALGDQMADPVMRIFEGVYADPSPEKIAAAVAQANAQWGEGQDNYMAILRNLIEKEYLDTSDPLYATMLGKIGASLPGPPVELEAGRERAELDAPAAEGETRPNGGPWKSEA